MLLLCSAAISLGPGPARAAAPRRLALLPIDAINLTAAETSRYRSVIDRALRLRQRFELAATDAVERSMADRPAECTRQVPCLQQAGHQLGASLLLTLRIGRLGETTVVQMTAFDVTRGARIGSWEEVLRPGDTASVERALDRMVERFAPFPVAADKLWYQRWWVWPAVGVAVAGALTTAVLLARRDGVQGPDHIIRPP